MMSLRTKLTLALLAMSLAAIAVVGATARSVTLSRFNDFVVERAVEGFLREAADYHQAYGSWEAAVASESFFDFVARTRTGALAAGPTRSGPGNNGTGGGRSSRPPPRRLGGEPPPFTVVDRNGRVLLPIGGVPVGESVSADQLASARPIMDGPREIGLAVASRRPAMTALEERYLSALEESWLYSLLLASALAVPLGLFLGDRLARPMRDMAEAMRRMEGGKLRQSVAIRSRDELGMLSESFNRMSAQLADAYEELEELSHRDELTGLFNRRAFDERAGRLLAQARRYGHPTCVAMLDIDHFKRVNDDFSHALGDQVLVEVARILNRELREVDLVARYGGEEFVIIFPETGGSAAVVLAERIRATFEQADWAGLDAALAITVSVGVAAATDTDSLGSVLERADKRLYRAKSHGRNRVEA